MTATLREDQELINRITYLSSLASVIKDIDPMMDTLRSITSRWQAAQPLQSGDRSALQKLESDLKKYLLTKDPVRSFTPQSLERQLAKRGHAGISPITRAFVILLGALGLITFLPYILPWEISQETRNYLSSELYLTTITGGIAWFYLSAVRNFKTQVRKAFAYITIGIAFLTVNFLQFIFILSFDLFEIYPWLRHGGVTLLPALFYIFLYAGIRKYALLLGIRSRLASLRWAGLCAIALAAVSMLAPHSSVRNELHFDFFYSWLAGTVVMAFFVAGLSYKIKQSVTAAYARSMRWFNIYAWLMAVSATGGIALVFVIGELNEQQLALLTSATASLQQLLLLYSAYALRQDTSEYANPNRG